MIGDVQPVGETPPAGVFAGIAVVDRQIALIAALHQEIAELRKELADLTRLNDRLQNQNAGYLCRIEELNDQVDELREWAAG